MEQLSWLSLGSRAELCEGTNVPSRDTHCPDAGHWRKQGQDLTSLLPHTGPTRDHEAGVLLTASSRVQCILVFGTNNLLWN